MGGVDFRSARRHEPPRAKRKCRVVLRNSRSRSSSHSENDADYLMGLRKTGSSREYNSIDVRFTTTMNDMALAMRHQRMRDQSAITEGDDDIKALTQSLAGGMRIDSEESPLLSPGPVLETILESTEPIDENSATEFILEEYMTDDNKTVVADDEESLAGSMMPFILNTKVEQSPASNPRTQDINASQDIDSIRYARPKWNAEWSTSALAVPLPSMSVEAAVARRNPSHMLPSLFDIGVLQYVPNPAGSSMSRENPLSSPHQLVSIFSENKWSMDSPEEREADPIDSRKMLEARIEACRNMSDRSYPTFPVIPVLRTFQTAPTIELPAQSSNAPTPRPEPWPSSVGTWGNISMGARGNGPLSHKPRLPLPIPDRPVSDGSSHYQHNTQPYSLGQ